MKKLKNYIKNSSLCFAILTSVLISNQAIADDLAIEHGYIRATIPGTNVSSAYMEIKNLSDNNKVLIGASSKVSDRIEIHEHILSEEMMRMRQRESLIVPANDQVTLQPSGYHLMIFNLIQPLKVDDKVELTLHFSKHSDVIVTLPVQSIKRKKTKDTAHSHHH